MDLRQLVSLLRRYLILQLILIGSGLGVALLYCFLQTPQYQATSKVFVAAQQATTVQDLSQGSTFSEQITQSYADVVVTPIVLTAVKRQLGLAQSTDDLAQQITASAPTDSVVLSISVKDASPATAARIANSVSQNLSQVAGDLTPTGGSDASPVKITQIQPAVPLAERVYPRWLQTAIIGALIGWALAIVVGYLRDRLDTRLKSAQEVRELSGRPMLGAVPFAASVREAPLPMMTQPRGIVAESYRIVRTNLQFVELSRQQGRLVVTSALPSEGKTTTTCNLAVALSDLGKRILVIDADLRRPAVARTFAIDGSVGLTDVLVSATSLTDAIQRIGEDGPFVLPAGTLPPNPSELLQSSAMRDVLSYCQTEYDYVLLDTPPTLLVPDAAVLAAQESGLIMVSAVRRTTRGQLRAAFQALEQTGAQVLGVVATMVAPSKDDAYAYSYGGYGVYTSHGTEA